MTTASYKTSIRKIKEELYEFNPLSSLSTAIEYLNEHKDAKEPFQAMPWIILFVLKLAMINGNNNGKTISKKAFLKTANKLFNMQSLAADLSSGNFQGELRPMLLQQQWYQRDLNEDLRSMVRQLLWFDSDNNYYDEQFKKITGIHIKTYITISFYVCMDSMRNAKHGVSELNVLQMLHVLSPRVSIKEIFIFFKLTSIKANELPAFFKTYELGDEPQSEFFQPPVLQYRPLIVDGDRVYMLTSQICVAGLSSKIPIVLKKKLKESYKSELGTLMERYIEKLMKQSGIHALNEKELLKIYAKHGASRNNEICDFAITSDINILIESKAIEPNDIVKSSAVMSLLQRNLADSFIKSIDQGQRTASILNLENKDSIGSHYLLVITHEEFWYPTARDVCQMIDHDLEKRIKDSYGAIPIELEKIAFITIGMFETLTQLHASGKIDFKDIITKSFDRLKLRENKRISFGITINEVIGEHSQLHATLKEKSEEILNELLKCMESNKPYWSNRALGLMSAHQRLMVSLDIAFEKDRM